MKIERNERKLCGDKSRHIDIRYFFVKDVLSRENIQICHYPTERMIADYLTKPSQGNQLKTLRDIIMGLKSFSIEERVGNTGDGETVNNMAQNEQKSNTFWMKSNVVFKSTKNHFESTNLRNYELFKHSLNFIDPEGYNN